MKKLIKLFLAGVSAFALSQCTAHIDADSPDGYDASVTTKKTTYTPYGSATVKSKTTYSD